MILAFILFRSINWLNPLDFFHPRYLVVVPDVAVSPDNALVVTAGLDGTVRIWDIDYQVFVTSVCQTFTRNFTELERELAHLDDTKSTCSL